MTEPYSIVFIKLRSRRQTEELIIRIIFMIHCALILQVGRDLQELLKLIDRTILLARSSSVSEDAKSAENG